VSEWRSVEKRDQAVSGPAPGLSLRHSVRYQLRPVELHGRSKRPNVLLTRSETCCSV
jgi:hypothetical protein